MSIHEWLTPKEAAKVAGTSVSFIRSKVASGELKHERKDRTILIHRDDAENASELRKRVAKASVGDRLERVEQMLERVLELLDPPASQLVQAERAPVDYVPHPPANRAASSVSGEGPRIAYNESAGGSGSAGTAVTLDPPAREHAMAGHDE